MPIYSPDSLEPEDGVSGLIRATRMIGGYRSVADETERDAIDISKRVPGMVVRVNATGREWVLGNDLTTWSFA